MGCAIMGSVGAGGLRGDGRVGVGGGGGPIVCAGTDGGSGIVPLGGVLVFKTNGNSFNEQCPHGLGTADPGLELILDTLPVAVPAPLRGEGGPKGEQAKGP